jgi:hypothetical protein
MRILLLIGTIYFLPNYCFATTVLALRTNDALFVAADSLIMDGGSFRGHLCKVVIAPNHIFAAAGILRDTVGRFGLHPVRLTPA